MEEKDERIAYVGTLATSGSPKANERKRIFKREKKMNEIIKVSRFNHETIPFDRKSSTSTAQIPHYQ